MEVESDRVVPTYRFSIEASDGIGKPTVFELSEKMLGHFLTLENMVIDLNKEDASLIIPIATPIVTPELMEIMIHFYEAYDNYDEDLDRKTKMRLLRDLTNNEKSSLYREWVFLRSDEYEMVELARVADYLEAPTLTVFIVDEIYAELYALSPIQLERRYLAVSKRKLEQRDDTSSSSTKRPLRLQYKREERVQAILSSMLPYTLVRGIDARIGKYIPLLVGNNYLIFIRDQDGTQSPLLFRHESLETFFVHSASRLSLSKGYRTLYGASSSSPVEVSVGGIFYTILNEKNTLSSYGEVTEETRGFDTVAGDRTIPERLMDEPCLAVWSGFQIVIMLTHDAVYSFGTWRQLTKPYRFYDHPRVYGPGDTGEQRSSYPVVIGGFEPNSLLDVACGASHTLFLTRDGLFGCGDNRNGALGIEEDGITVTPFLIDVYGQTIVKIWAGNDVSLLFTDKGVLYGAGINTEGQFGTSYDVNKPVKVWTEIATFDLMKGKIDILAGAHGRTVIVSNNVIYQLGREVNDIAHSELTFVPFNRGIIKELLVTTTYILVATTTDMYIISARGNAQAAIEKFGGSDSESSPYRLRIEVTLEDSIDETFIPNKKPRLACQACGAKARYAHNQATSFFCSKYCLHKSRQQ